jgi:hypothetical protein
VTKDPWSIRNEKGRKEEIRQGRKTERRKEEIYDSSLGCLIHCSSYRDYIRAMGYHGMTG